MNISAPISSRTACVFISVDNCRCIFCVLNFSFLVFVTMPWFTLCYEKHQPTFWSLFWQVGRNIICVLCLCTTDAWKLISFFAKRNWHQYYASKAHFPPKSRLFSMSCKVVRILNIFEHYLPHKFLCFSRKFAKKSCEEILFFCLNISDVVLHTHYTFKGPGSTVQLLYFQTTPTKVTVFFSCQV